jgi:hypothetical protein
MPQKTCLPSPNRRLFRTLGEDAGGLVGGRRRIMSSTRHQEDRAFVFPFTGRGQEGVTLAWFDFVCLVDLETHQARVRPLVGA